MESPLALGFARFEPFVRQLLALSGRVCLPGRAWAVWIYSVTLLPILALLVGLWFQPYVPVGELMRDMLLVAEVSEDCCHIYYGAVSNFGVLIWTGAAAILFFSAMVLMLAGKDRDNKLVLFFVLAGVLTTLLCVDDFYLVHDIVLPKFGYSETVAYAVYASVALVYCWVSREEIIAARWPMFVISIACLTLSVKIDVFLNVESDFRLLVEDGAKLLGIAAWFSFHAEAAACYLIKAGRHNGRGSFVRVRV